MQRWPLPPVFLLLFTLATNISTAQNTGRANSNITNQWQQEARPSKPFPSDPQQRAIRTARDQYSDKLFGIAMGVRQFANRGGSYGESWDGAAINASGIPDPYRNEIVALGSFADFTPVLTASQRSIYSEIHFHVDQQLYPVHGALAGRSIDLIAEGGTVQTSEGALSFKIAPKHFGLSPGGRYVVFLSYVVQGNFYGVDESIDVSSGLAMPNSRLALAAAQAGHWPLQSLTETALVSRLKTLLRAQQQ